jgi:signal transduction histidine kinase
LKNLANSIILSGTRDTQEDLKNDIVLLNSVGLLGAITCVITLLISINFRDPLYVMVNVITLMICISAIVSNKYKLHTLSVWIVAFVLPFSMLGYIYLFGNMGANYYLFVGMVLGLYFFRNKSWGIWLSTLVSGAGFVISKYIMIKAGHMSLEGIGVYLFFPNLILALGVMGFTTYMFKRYHLRQQEKIQSMNETRGKLISVLSHDMRSPLNNLQMLVDQAEMKSTDEEQRQIIMAMVSDSLKSTMLLLDNTTYWINKEKYGLTIQTQRVNINEHIAENVELYTNIAKHKDLSIVNLIRNNHTVSADPNILNMIIRNLLSNAIKFSLSGSQPIEISSYLEGDDLTISIRDHGTGMSWKELEEIQSSSITSRSGTFNEHSTGMGLILIKYFLELMEGELMITSTKTEGTTASFSLPLLS